VLLGVVAVDAVTGFVHPTVADRLGTS